MKLTDRQREALQHVADCWAGGWLPTVRELAEALGGIAVNGAYQHLRALDRKGLIKMPGHGKQLRLLAAGIREAGYKVVRA